MDYIIKNKIVSLGASSTVRDTQGNDLFIVRGRFFTFTKKKIIMDLAKKPLYQVRNKFWHIIMPKVFVWHPGERNHYGNQAGRAPAAGARPAEDYLGRYPERRLLRAPGPRCGRQRETGLASGDGLGSGFVIEKQFNV